MFRKGNLHKYFILILSTIFIFSPFSHLSNTSLAQQPKNASGDFGWAENSDGTITIVEYTGTDTDLVIPSEIDGKTVTAIGKETIGIFEKGVFQEKGLTNIVLPDTIEKIWGAAFAENNLTEVVIPDSVDEIGFNAFYLNELSSVNFSENLTKIGYGAFSGNKLTSISIPDSVTEIEGGAFADNQLEEVTLSKNLTELSNRLFYNNNLESLTLPESITKIGNDAFRENDHLKEINFPSNLEEIGNQAFSGTSLEDVFIPKSVKSIGARAFQMNEIETLIFEDGRSADLKIGNTAFAENKIKSLIIPEGVTEIEAQTFQNNKIETVQLPTTLKQLSISLFRNNKLTSVTIPEGVESIGYQAFGGNNISNVHIPKSVMFYTPPFTNNPLETVSVDPDNSEYMDNNGKGVYKKANPTHLIQGTKSGEIAQGTEVLGSSSFYGVGLTGHLVIPDSVNEIASHAFAYNDLTSVVISNSITEINNFVFRDNLLTDVTFPDGLIEIGLSAFENNKLEEITFPPNLKVIGGLAFKGNEFTEITIPNHVETLGASGFSNNKLSKFLLPEHFDSIPSTFFQNNNFEKVEIPEHIKTLGTYSFSGNNVQEVIIRSKDEFLVGYGSFTDFDEDGNENKIEENVTIWHYPTVDLKISPEHKYYYRELSEQGVTVDGDRYNYNFEEIVPIIDEENRVLGKIMFPDIFETEPSSSDVYISVKSVNDGLPEHLDKAGSVFDISFTDYEGNPLTVTGDFKLSLFVENNNDSAQIYHEVEEGDWTLVGGKNSDPKGYIEVDVTHFSKYGVFVERTIDIPVEKVWAGEKQAEVTVNLYRNGAFYDYRTLSDYNEWKDVFRDLPMYDDDGPIEYTVDEEEVPGYEKEISGNAETGFVITNTEIVPETIDITVTKEWIGTPGESVTVYLLVNGDRYLEEVAELSAENDWTYTFYNMPLEFDGFPFEYSVTEIEIEGYETTISGNAEDGFVITNTEIIPEPETIDITVTKEWVGTPGEEVYFYLIVNGDHYPEVPIKLSAENDWTYTFTDMPVAYDGIPVEYSVTEIEVEGYETTISGSAEDGFVITNTEIIPESKGIDITVSKEWIGTPGEVVYFHLLINGDNFFDTPIELSAENEWTYTFYNMPLEFDGLPMEYSVIEIEVEGYESTISGSAEEGFVITNTEIVEEGVEEEEEVTEEDEEAEEATEEDEDEGDELPKTATNYYNLLLIGSLLLLGGIGTILIYRSRKSTS